MKIGRGYIKSRETLISILLCPLLTVPLSKFLKTSLSLVFFIYNIGMKSPTLQVGETVKIK